MNTSEFKQSFFKGKGNKSYLIATIKEKCSTIDELLKYDRLFLHELKLFKGLFEKSLYGNNNTPQSYKELDGPISQIYTNSLAKEINWQVLGFIKNHQLISHFLTLRNGFEHNLIVGDYQKAREFLDRVDSEICASYWGVENRLILDELQFGSERNWTTRNRFLETENFSNVRVLADFFSFKAESKVSFFQYNEYFSKWEEFQAKSEYGLSHDMRNYMRFKGNYFSLKKYDNLQALIFHESSASIIDRYVLVIRILQHLFESNELGERKVLINSIIKLSEKVEDISLVNILLLNNSSFNYPSLDESALRALDAYTTGRYLDAINFTRTILEGKSYYLEFVLVYVKSLIELDLPYSDLTEVPSLLNTICTAYYKILKKTEDCDASFIDLIKYAYTFNNSYLGLQLYSLVKEQLGWETSIDYTFLSRISSQFINPILFESIHQEEISKCYISNLKLISNASVTINTFNEINDSIHGFEEFSLSEDVPLIKTKLYNARYYLLKHRYQDALNLFAEISIIPFTSPITEYEVISGVFKANLILENSNECLICFVDAFLKNPHLTKQMDNESLLTKIIGDKFKNQWLDKGLIEFPIFFKVTCDDKIRVKQSYELFLRVKKCEKPSQLMLLDNNFNKQKFIFFLRYVCVPETMQLSRYFDSSYAVNEERIRICQGLATLDPENSSNYNEEIANITQKNSISRVIGRIDEGKIYVNEDRIRHLLLKPESKSDVSKLNTTNSDKHLTKEFFYRTLDLKRFAENNEYKINTIFLANLDNDGQLMIQGNPAFDDFKKIFLEIRDYFVISNEFGLDAYLSTRIRHGTLPNHIRSVFERLNLVTAQIDGIYAANDYWNERLALTESKKENLQGLLSNFSAKIDEISSYLKEELIQCKTEKRQDKKNALFNYSYSTDLELLQLYIKVDKYEDFVDLCLNELWNRTEFCLSKIREILNGTIKTQFIDLITDLESSLESLDEKNTIYELSNNVNLSRTEIQILLNNIEKWFQRANSSFDGDYELSMIAETSIQISKNVNPTYSFEIDTDIVPDAKIGGEYHQHFIDILRNFLENMIKRSQLNGNSLNPFMSVQKNEETLILNFQNNLCNSINRHELREKLENVQKNWLLLDNNVSKEEGTGFSKIKKILHSDLARTNSRFRYEILEERLSLTLSFETDNLIR